MKQNLTTKSLVAAAMLAAASSASAVDLTWVDSAFTDASQVSNSGNLIYALNFGTATDVTVNGVLFDGSVAGELEDGNGSAIAVAPLIQWGSSDDQTGNSGAGYGTALGVTGLGATDEVNLLNSFTYGNSQGIGFELRGLNAGTQYTVQALVVDNRGSFTTRQLHFSENGGTWASLLVDYTSNGSPAYARIVETTFTADGSTQAFRQGIQGTGEIHFNALQMRAAADPFADGSFEAPGMTDVANGNPGTANITSGLNGQWVGNGVGQTSLHDGLFFGLDPAGGETGTAAFDGDQYVAFNAAGQGGGGALSQTFDTVIGELYLVEFSIAGLDFDGSSQQIIADVTGAGGGLGGLTQAATNGVWTTHSFTFTADDVTSTLTFTDDLQAGGGSSDLGLDGVSVSIVPEPGSLALLGLGGLLVARRRRY